MSKDTLEALIDGLCNRLNVLGVDYEVYGYADGSTEIEWLVGDDEGSITVFENGFVKGDFPIGFFDAINL